MAVRGRSATLDVTRYTSGALKKSPWHEIQTASAAALLMVGCDTPYSFARPPGSRVARVAYDQELEAAGSWHRRLNIHLSVKGTL